MTGRYPQFYAGISKRLSDFAKLLRASGTSEAATIKHANLEEYSFHAKTIPLRRDLEDLTHCCIGIVESLGTRIVYYVRIVKET